MRGDIVSDGMEAGLPPIYGAVLTPARLADLLADIEEHATWTEVRLREGLAGSSTIGSIRLEELAAWLAGTAESSAQVRYDLEGRQWCDSILRTRGGFRLVRVELCGPEGGDPKC